MHAGSLLHDLVGGAGGRELHGAMRMIEAAGRGVIVLLRDYRTDGISTDIRRGRERGASPALRDYGIGAQILADLGLARIIRLSNHPRPVVGLEGYGLEVVETRPVGA